MAVPRHPHLTSDTLRRRAGLALLESMVVRLIIGLRAGHVARRFWAQISRSGVETVTLRTAEPIR